MMRAFLLILLIGASFNIDAQTQVPILERRVTVHATNQPLYKVLKLISEAGNFTFSYKASLFKGDRIVTLKAERRTVKDVLDELFDEQLSYQQIGNHLVLQKKVQAHRPGKVSNAENQDRYDMVVAGYLKDSYSGLGIAEASLYHKPTLANTLSDEFGYYKLRIVSKTKEFVLQIRKEGYKDTSVVLASNNTGVIEFSVVLEPLLKPIEVTYEKVVPQDSMDTTIKLEPDSIVLEKDSLPDLVLDTVSSESENRLAWIDSLKKLKNVKIQETKLGKWVIGAYNNTITNNIRDSFYRSWQATFVPPLGTNGTLSGMVVNKFSFNLLVGYNGGLDGAEFGGLLNLVRQDANGAQFAGLGNAVGGTVRGAQFAGLFNHNLGHTKGFQAASLYNYSSGIMSGCQAAGIANIVNEGFAGTQLSAFGNYSRSLGRGVQVAGILNMANTIDGGQIAAVVNIAHKVRGFQIGLVNIADSSEGIAIGIINFIRSGIHQLEFSSNELGQYGIGYRSGAGRFYSVIHATSQFPIRDTGTLMGYGFSLGHRAKLSKTFYWTTDLGSEHMTFNLSSNHLNLHNRLNTGLEIRLFKGLAVFGGVSLNHMINDTRDKRYETRFSVLAPDPIWTYKAVYAQRAWLGWQFGLRLF